MRDDIAEKSGNRFAVETCHIKIQDSDLTATVVRKAFKGPEILYTLRVNDGSQVLSLFPSHADYELGESVSIRLQADHLVAFPRVDHVS